MSESETESLSDSPIDDEPIEEIEIEKPKKKVKATTKRKPKIDQEDNLDFKNGELKVVKLLKKPRKPMTPEQKKALVERLRAGKEKKKKEMLGQLEEPNIEPELVKELTLSKEQKKIKREKTKKKIKEEAMKILKEEKIKELGSETESDSESDDDPDYKEVVKYVTKKKEKKKAKNKAKAKANKTSVIKSQSKTNDVVYQQYEQPQYTFL
tara:strand:+ start:151 stop:780 length:630 start_codon:yes stop_codon:yes gene_type:complete